MEIIQSRKDEELENTEKQESRLRGRLSEDSLNTSWEG